MNTIYPLFVTALFVDFLIQTPGVPPVILHVHGPSLYDHTCLNIQTPGVPPVILHVHLSIDHTCVNIQTPGVPSVILHVRLSTDHTCVNIQTPVVPPVILHVRLSTDHTCVNIQTPGVPPVILHVHGPSLYRPYMCKHTDTWGPSCHTSCTWTVSLQTIHV